MQRLVVIPTQREFTCFLDACNELSINLSDKQNTLYQSIPIDKLSLVPYNFSKCVRRYLEEINMQSKLTLRLDETLIAEAKKYAQDQGKSLSQIVADYFSALTAQPQERDKDDLELAPLTASLLGSCADLSNRDDDQLREEYIDYLEEKYR